MKRCFVVFVIFLSCALAACGGPTSSSVTATPGTMSATGIPTSTASAANGSPNALFVTRTDPSATGNIGSLNKIVTDSSTVQKLYSMAHQLPAYPVGSSISQSCLSDLGVIYHLDFRQDSSDVQRMNLDPGNCKILYFSQTDLRQASDSFLTLLKQALHVNSLTSS